MGKENTSRTKRDIEYCCELKRKIKHYSGVIDPLGELERMFRNMPFGAEINESMPEEDIAAVQRKITAYKEEYEKLASELKSVILMNIEDENQLMVLKLRYAEGKDWSEVIGSMPYSDRYVYKFHSDALKILDEVRCS